MNSMRWATALALAAVLIYGCGPVHVAKTAAAPSPSPWAPPSATLSPSPIPTYQPAPTATAASPARTECPEVQSAPQFQPNASSNRNLALVWLKGSTSFVVRDVTDINHPFTVSTPALDGTPLFVSASELESDFVRAPLSGSPKTTVVRCTWNGGFLAWGPDGTYAAYIVVRSDSTGAELHLIAGGTDRRVMTGLMFPWGTDCISPACSDRLDMRLLYSPDGRYISFIQSWGGSVLRVWKADGTLLKSVDDNSARAPLGAPTMSVWSGASLYFRDGKGVEMWHDGTQSIVLANVMWIRPKASPAGGQIVFEARDASGVPSVFILDTSSGSTRTIARLRSEPAFLTSRYLWYKGERPCATGDQYPCGAGATTIATGTTYIYDLQTAVESQSIITTVWDVWPHPA